MDQLDRTPSIARSEERIDNLCIDPVSEKSTDGLNDPSRSCSESADENLLFNRFNRLQSNPTEMSNVEDGTQKLTESILLWRELLREADRADASTKQDFDQQRTLLTQVFVDVHGMAVLKNDRPFARRTFFGYLDTLDTEEIHKLLTAESLSTLADAIRESNVYILISILSTLCELVQFVDADMPDQYTPLLNAMRLHVEHKLRSNKSSALKKKLMKSLHEPILKLLWNVSDQSVVVPSLLRAGFGKSIMEWWLHPKLTTNERRPMVSIIHNISRHDEGADELNRYGAIETLKRWQAEETVGQWEVSLIITMALAHLSSPDQIRADPTGTKSILDQLLQTTINASNAERHRFNGFHVSEPLSVLVKLFVDDATIDYVMNHTQLTPPVDSTSILNLFTGLLMRLHVTFKTKDRLEQFTCIALYNIIWSISFHETYHATLKQNIELINLIKSLAQDHELLMIEQYVPRSMLSIKKATDGILFNLGQELPTITIPSEKKQKPLVMVSYCHANDAFCDRILALLDEQADLLDVWIDRRFCKSSADVWESIAKGIKSAQLIVCIISTEYIASKACRQEIIYAKDRLNKRFLPVYLEKPEVSDWLGE